MSSRTYVYLSSESHQNVCKKADPGRKNDSVSKKRAVERRKLTTVYAVFSTHAYFPKSGACSQAIFKRASHITDPHSRIGGDHVDSYICKITIDFELK